MIVGFGSQEGGEVTAAGAVTTAAAAGGGGGPGGSQAPAGLGALAPLDAPPFTVDAPPFSPPSFLP